MQLTLIFLFGISVSLSWAWIPFFGEESHKHLNLMTKHGEWDLLQMVALNSSQEGVSVAGRLGPLNATAYRLKDQYDRGLVGPVTTAKMVGQLKDDLSFYCVLQQLNSTVATLLSAGVPGSVRPWLQITSDLRHRRLQVLYRVKEDPHTHQAVFPLPKKMGHTWVKMLLSVSGLQAKLWVNCDTVEKRDLAGPIDLKMPKGGVLYFSKEPTFKNKLLGSVQAAKLLNFTPSSRLWRCQFDGLFGPGWKPPLIG